MDQGSSDVNLIDIQHRCSPSIFGVNSTATMQDERNAGVFCDVAQELQVEACLLAVYSSNRNCQGVGSALLYHLRRLMRSSCDSLSPLIFTAEQPDFRFENC